MKNYYFSTTPLPIELEGSIKKVLQGSFFNLIELPNGDLATGSLDFIQIWDTKIWNIKRTLPINSYRTSGFGLLSNGNLVTCSYLPYDEYKSQMKIWNLTYFNQVQSFVISERCHFLLVLPNDDIVIGHDSSFSIVIRESLNGGIKLKLNGHSDLIQKIILLENGFLASGSYDKTIKIWDLNTGTLFRTINGHMSLVQSLSVLSNGNLVSVSNDQYIKIWNPFNGSEIEAINSKIPLCGSMILKNGNLLTGSCTGIIQEWNLTTKLNKTLINNHTYVIHNFKFLRNNYWASQSWAREMYIWS